MAPIEIQQSTGEGSGASFTFAPLHEPLPGFKSGEAKDHLVQWNLAPHMRSASFRFDQAFSAEQTDAFLMDFFSSSAFGEVCTSPTTWDALGAVPPGGVKYTRLPATVLRLDFFDRLKDAGIVRCGDVAKCLDNQVGEVLVSDRLRQMLLDDSCEDYDLFSEAERSELIFHVLKRLAVGGGMNQWDEQIEPYLKLTKDIYKDLVTVNRSAAGALQVSSLTFAVESVSGASVSLFPRSTPHNFCYVCVDPAARHVKLWYSAWFPMM